MGAGRPTLYTDELNQQAKDYVNGGYEDAEHPFPSIVGMAVVLNIAKSTLYTWADDNRGEISDTLDQCQDSQELKVMIGSITNVLNPTISKLVLANFGYHDKQDSTIGGKDGAPIAIQEITRTVIDVGS